MSEPSSAAPSETVVPAKAPPKTNDEASAPAGLVDSLKSLGEIAGVLTGIAFITGWLYWSTYYSSFGLNPLELGFSVAVVSVSPVQVMLRDLEGAEVASKWSLFVALVAYVAVNALLAALYVHYRTNRRPHDAGRARLLLLALAVGMFGGGYVLGRYDAALDATCNSRLPDVAFLPSADHPPTEADNAATCVLDNELTCKLVLHANSTYYYFQSPARGPDGECSGAAADVGAGFATSALPDSEVRMVQVLRHTGW